MIYTSKSFTTEHSLEDADACFLGVPFDSTSSARPLQRYGPTLIREALRHANFYLPETGGEVDARIHDAGDVDVAHGSFEETDQRMRDTIQSLRTENPEVFPVFLGGEHSISLSAVREMAPDTIVSLDAHTDLWEEYHGVEYSHATWLHHAKEELGCNVVLQGTRAWPSELEEELETVMDELPSDPGSVYLTIDMDVFDPAYAPSVAIPEPHGLTPRGVFNRIDDVFGEDVIGMDIVELSSRELGDRTSALAARTVVRSLYHLG